MKNVVFYSPDLRTFKNPEREFLYSCFVENFENYWFGHIYNSEAEIRYICDDFKSELIIGADEDFGIYLHYYSMTTKQDMISLFDYSKLDEVIYGSGRELYASKGCFLPKDIAWDAISDFIENGRISEKIRWISPDDIPEDGNYF